MIRSVVSQNRRKHGAAVAPVILFLVAASLLSGCATNATLGGTPASASSSQGAVSAQGAQPSSPTVSQDSAKGEGFTSASVNEQVLFEQEGVKVTLNSLDTAAGSDAALLLTVENSSDIDVSVYPTFTAVNGYMVTATDIIEAHVGETVEGRFTFVGDSLREFGITDIAKIQLCLGIAAANAQGMASSSYTSSPMTIETSLFGQTDLSCTDKGTLTWSGGGVRVYQGEFVQDKGHGIAALPLWVVNETDEPLVFNYSLAGINGLSVEGYHSEQLAAGARCQTYVFVDDAMARANLGNQTVASFDVSYSVDDMHGGESAVSEMVHVTVA